MEEYRIKIFKVQWINTGRIDVLIGNNLLSAFKKAGLFALYYSGLYRVLTK